MKKLLTALFGLALLLLVFVDPLTGEPSATEASVGRADRTRQQLHVLRGALAVFKIRTQRWPRVLDDLVRAGMLKRLPKDGWAQSFVWIRPVDDRGHGCLLSVGRDGKPGTEDDLFERCDRTLLNQHLLMEAGLAKAADRLDAYGNPILLLPTAQTLMVWSYGPDGKPDTEDDQVARVAKKDH